MDRHTVSGIGGIFVESVSDEYLENNCADDPVKLCDFQLLENKIMKTVDSVYQVNTYLCRPRPKPIQKVPDLLDTLSKLDKNLA